MILRHIKTGEPMEAVVREDGRIITGGAINDPGDLARDFTIGKCSDEELRKLHRHGSGALLAATWGGGKLLESDHTTMKVTLPVDEDGFLGRQCPSLYCRRYFKITPGTGLTGDNLPCHCPYCGHADDAGDFYTEEQVEYAKALALNLFERELLKKLKTMEFEHKPRPGTFGIGISLKVTGRPDPVYVYQEKDLETVVVCDLCALRYAVYGVFAFCPDCGAHNSYQTLIKSLEVVGKIMAVAGTIEDDEVVGHMVGNSLEDAVAAFDAFGREAARVWGSRQSPPRELSVSFQNLESARGTVHREVGFDVANAVDASEWEFACRCFQKRHLLAHKMGVIDEGYVRKAKDPEAVLGRKVRISKEEVIRLLDVLMRIGGRLSLLAGTPPQSPPFP
jgi:hypothetical protein